MPFKQTSVRTALRRAAALFAVAAVAVGSAVMLPAAASAAPPATASISGTVTAPDAPGGVEGLDVAAWVLQDDSYVYAGEDDHTAADGSYTITGLPAGTYTLQFDKLGNPDSLAGYNTQWWDDQPAEGTPTPITVADGQAVTGEDAVMVLATTVSGTVYGADAPTTPLAGAYYELCANDHSTCVFGSADSNGNYLITNIVPGDYTLAVYTASGYVQKDVDLTLAEGDNLTQDVTLDPGASISGTVNDVDDPSADMSGVEIDLFNAFPAGGFVTSTIAASDGTYSFGSLPAGDYTVEFANESPTYAAQWWANEPTAEASDSIPLTVGQNETDIDAGLNDAPTTGTISGTITDVDTNDPIPDAEVSLYTEAGDYDGTVEGDPDGTYEFSNIAPGQYTVLFGDDEVDYLQQWWNNKTSESSATTITIAAGSVITANAKLSHGGVITGRLTNTDGDPVEGVTVHALGTSTTGQDKTDANGDYTIYALTSGFYDLEFEPASDSVYAAQWWNNSLTVSGDTQLRITTGQTVSGKDAVLQRAGTISGTVLAGTPASGLANVTVSAWDDATGFEVAATTTGSDGRYTFPQLAPASYHVEFEAPNGSSYADQWWENTADPSESAAIPVTASGAVTGIDADLLLSLTTHTPTISGTTTVGNVLTASAGTWGPAPVDLTYQWLRGSTPIDNATGLDYTLTTDDAGQRISVTVTGSKDGYETASVTSSSKSITGGVFTTTPVPTISSDSGSGAPLVGATLTADPGTWAPSGISLRYQWYRGSTAISRATNSTYTLATADIGSAISVRVTGSKTGFTSVTEPSLATATVLGVLTSSTPTISGVAEVGQQLTAAIGTWGPAPITFDYVWTRDGVAIDGAPDSDTYTLANDDAGTSVAVEVTGTKTNYALVTRASTGTDIVSGGTLGAVTPTISGDAVVGHTLTAVPGTWTPGSTTFTYQWLRDGSPITDATSSTYPVVNADAASVLSVTVTGSAPGFGSLDATSDPTDAVTGGVLTKGTPIISGKHKVGQTLTVDPGAWGPAPVTLSYQWLRDGSPISGATDTTYTLVSADAGADITVTVTGEKPGFTTANKPSAAASISKASSTPGKSSGSSASGSSAGGGSSSSALASGASSSGDTVAPTPKPSFTPLPSTTSTPAPVTTTGPSTPAPASAPKPHAAQKSGGTSPAVFIWIGVGVLVIILAFVGWLIFRRRAV